MNLFSFFKPKPKMVVETKLGMFTLNYSKKGRNIWGGSTHGIPIYVSGTESQPDIAQINFLENLEAEIEKIDTAISKKFISEFKEAEVEINITKWQERFKLASAEVMLIFEKKAYWNITFEDTNEPYAHFNLFIEGEKLTDFSIDT